MVGWSECIFCSARAFLHSHSVALPESRHSCVTWRLQGCVKCWFWKLTVNWFQFFWCYLNGDCCSCTAWHAYTVLTSSSSEALRGPVYVLGPNSGTKRESILHNVYIIYCICWFSCKKTFTFSISRSVLKLNKSHTTMLLQSQKILGSSIWHDFSLVNIPSSKKSVVCKQQSTSWDPLHAKINDCLSGHFMMTSSQ